MPSSPSEGAATRRVSGSVSRLAFASKGTEPARPGEAGGTESK